MTDLIVSLVVLCVLALLVVAGAEPHPVRALAQPARVRVGAWRYAGRRWAVRVEWARI